MIAVTRPLSNIIYEALLEFCPSLNIICNGKPLLVIDSQRDVSHGVVITVVAIIIITIMSIIVVIALVCILGSGRGCLLYVVAYIIAPSRLWSPWASPRVESGM